MSGRKTRLAGPRLLAPDTCEQRYVRTVLLVLLDELFGAARKRAPASRREKLVKQERQFCDLDHALAPYDGTSHPARIIRPRIVGMPYLVTTTNASKKGPVRSGAVGEPPIGWGGVTPVIGIMIDPPPYVPLATGLP